MKNFVGIIGGVGPFASSYFYDMILKKTEACKDQDHINMMILNHSDIPDRTAFILNESTESPLPFLEEDVKLLNNMGARLIFIPCNTSHYFYENLSNMSDVPILNMISDTVEYTKNCGFKNVLLMATAGTIKSKLYQNMCEKKGLNYIEPDDETLKMIMNIIYGCVKSGKPVNREDFLKIVSHYENVDGYILGCTELSILKGSLNLPNSFIDPLEIEASNIIKFFDKKEKNQN